MINPFTSALQAVWRPFKRRYDKLDKLSGKANKSLDVQARQLKSIGDTVASLQKSVQSLDTRMAKLETLVGTQCLDQLSQASYALRSIEHLLTLNDVSNEETAHKLDALCEAAEAALSAVSAQTEDSTTRGCDEHE